MKIWKIGIGFFVVFMLLQFDSTVYAASVDSIIEETEHIAAPFGFRASDMVRKVLSGQSAFSFQALLEWLGRLFFGEWKKTLSLTAKMIAAGMLSGVLVRFPGGDQKIAGFACAVFISTIALQSFSYAQSITEETTDGLFLFVQGLMPSVGAAVVASGSAGGAATCSLVFTAMQVFMQILRRFMLPLVAVTVVLSVADGLGEERYLSGVTTLCKQLFRWSTGLLLLFYGAAVGLQTGTAAIFDRLAGKTAKYAISSFVPVVGGALSDSLETVTVSAKAIRGALGISGIVGVGFVAVSPVVTLSTLSLSCKLAGAVVSLCGEKKMVQMIQEIGSGITRLLAVVASSSVMFFISVAMLCFIGGAA